MDAEIFRFPMIQLAMVTFPTPPPRQKQLTGDKYREHASYTLWSLDGKKWERKPLHIEQWISVWGIWLEFEGSLHPWNCKGLARDHVQIITLIVKFHLLIVICFPIFFFFVESDIFWMMTSLKVVFPSF